MRVYLHLHFVHRYLVVTCLCVCVYGVASCGRSGCACVCIYSTPFFSSVGKTLAYAIPVVQDLQSISPSISRADGPYAVVITPTREVGHTPCVCLCVSVCLWVSEYVCACVPLYTVPCCSVHAQCSAALGQVPLHSQLSYSTSHHHPLHSTSLDLACHVTVT